MSSEGQQQSRITSSDDTAKQQDTDAEKSEKFSTLPLNMVLALAALFIVIGGLKLGSDLIIPILLSMFLAILCSQPVRWLSEKGWNTALAVFVVLFVGGILFGLISLLIGSQLSQFSDQMPVFSERLSQLYHQGLDLLQHWGIPVDQNEIAHRFDPSQFMHYVPSLLSRIGDTLSQTVVIVIMAVFMIFDIMVFPQKLRQALKHPESSLDRFAQFSTSLTRYLLVKSEIGLICAVLTVLVCWCLGVQFALIWGVLAFLLNYIPNIGAFLSAIPPVLLTLVMPDAGVVMAIILATILGVVHFTVGNILEPRLMGHALGISTLMAFMSLIIWGWVFGPIGLLLSVPLTMSLKILFDCHPDTRWLSVLIGPLNDRSKR